MTAQSQADAAATLLVGQIAILQADLTQFDGAGNASVDQLVQLQLDAQAAIVSADTLTEAHETVLTQCSGNFGPGVAADVTTTNVALLIASASGAVLAFDATNRLIRLQDNLQAS